MHTHKKFSVSDNGVPKKMFKKQKFVFEQEALL